MQSPPPNIDPETGIAPADARPHRRWRWWQIGLAYFLLIALASFSIWFIDRGAMHVAK